MALVGILFTGADRGLERDAVAAAQHDGEYDGEGMELHEGVRQGDDQGDHEVQEQC